MDISMSKKWIAAFAAIASLFIMLILFTCLPQTVLAATGTIGQETPKVFCTYTDSEGQQVTNPDELPAGTYDVTFSIEGMVSLSVIQVTATYDESVTFAQAPVSLISDADTGFSSEGYVIGDGNLVFGFVSNNSDCTAVDSEGTALATFTVTFANACDPDKIITVSSNPNLTFALADYGDGYDDEYAYVEDCYYEGYAGNLSYLAIDLSPVITSGGYAVSGSLVIMTDGSGNTAGNAVSGVYTIDVYSDADRTELVKSVTSVESVDENEVKTNGFVIDGLSANTTYYLSVSSEYALTREDITLIVGSADIAADAIPVIACDFNMDKTVTGADAITVFSNAAGEKNEYCDLNADGTVTGADAIIVYTCAANRNYAPITIQ